ncbi:MAG: hypothetical protein CL569_18565 [Alphaproteobacteria bacterium]|nr:hypothetical protein [Alphaproteobacteria bacterium]
MAVFILGGAHYYLQQLLLKIINRFNIDPGNNAALMRLNRLGILLIFLEVVLIYQVAQLTFETFVL